MSRHEIVYGEVYGRQPVPAIITPSNPNPWYGGIIEGEDFTHEQLAVLKHKGRDPALVDSIEVRREATTRELVWSFREPPPLFAFRCPVHARRADGTIEVISPAGMRKIVLADGWVKKPRGMRAYKRFM